MKTSFLRGVGVALLVFLGSLATAPQAQAANVDVTFSTQEVRGVRGTFGLSMHYAPSQAFVRPGSEVALGYAPGPLPATLIVDVIALLNSTGVNLPPAVAGIMDLLPGTFSVPIQDTPVGRYTVTSVPIYGGSGASVTLDVALEGQVNASLTTTAGALDEAALRWTAWGGQEATLTAPDAGTATVTASFAYYVSSAFLVVFDIASVRYEYPVATFPLGEYSSSRQAVSTVETVSPVAQDSTTAPFLTGLALILLFGGLGTGVAAGWWLRGRRASAVRRPSPVTTRKTRKTKDQINACGAAVVLLGLLSLLVGFGFLSMGLLLLGGLLLILGGLPIRWTDEDRATGTDKLDRLLNAYLDGRISKEVFERNADALRPPPGAVPRRKRWAVPLAIGVAAVLVVVLVLGYVLSTGLISGPGPGGGGDQVPPRVLSTTPGDGATGVDLLTTALEITFDENMDTSVDASIGIDVEPYVYPGCDATWPSSTKLRCTFGGNAYPFAPRTTYTVTLDGFYFRDTAGNSLGSHPWSFTTRAFAAAIQNQRGAYDPVSQYYNVVGELLNQESAVIATEYWGSTSGGSSPLQIDITYYDAGGSVVRTYQTLTPWIGGLKSGQKVPFRDLQYDPSQRIQSFSASLNATERLWKVAPYGPTTSDVQDRRVLGEYEVTGMVSNPGTLTIPVGELVVVCTFYMTDGKVYEYDEWSNSYIVNPGGSDTFTCSVTDPFPYRAVSYAVIVTTYFPP